MEGDSILNSIKQPHGIGPDDVGFDTDIIMHINSVFLTLRQLGLGPTEGFFIKDASTIWSDYIDDPLITEAIKSFMYLKVKLVFDPPTNASLLEALKSAADESQWRILEIAK